MTAQTRHYESTALVRAAATELFDHVDDPMRLSAHMSEASWMMGGSRMSTEVDSGGGKVVGSHIRMGGRVLGVQLMLDEVVAERDPPRQKVWETVGQPQLLVIGPYRMGFEITSRGNGSLLRVFIDYEMPKMAPARWLGRWFGPYYARWCTERMTRDAARYFAAARHSH